MQVIKNNLVHLDLLRGIAALFVVCGHLRGILFENAIEAADLSLWGKVFYFCTGLGHQSVMIFFVLSGFFIINSVTSSKSINALFWYNYGVNRLTRLWVVLFPALLITFVFDSIGYHFGSSNLYLGQYSFGGILDQDISANLGIECFISNLLFLNGIISPAYGSNGALWSLPYEFWFYVLFPLIFIFFKKGNSFLKRGLTAVLMLIIVKVIGIEIAKYFLIWCLGAIPIFILDKLGTISRLKRIFFNFFSFLFFFTVLFYSRTNNSSFIIDLFLGFSTCLLISVLVSNNDYFRYINYSKIVNFFSTISFTLYAVHLPFIFLVISYVDNNLLNLKFNGINFVVFLSFLIVTILFCYIVYYCFERNTYYIKASILKRLNPINKTIKT